LRNGSESVVAVFAYGAPRQSSNYDANVVDEDEGGA
jgi:hypothetical protein